MCYGLLALGIKKYFCRLSIGRKLGFTTFWKPSKCRILSSYTKHVSGKHAVQQQIRSSLRLYELHCWQVEFWWTTISHSLVSDEPYRKQPILRRTPSVLTETPLRMERGSLDTFNLSRGNRGRPMFQRLSCHRSRAQNIGDTLIRLTLWVYMS